MLDTWRPLGNGVVPELRRFFVGGSPELEDPTYPVQPAGADVSDAHLLLNSIEKEVCMYLLSIICLFFGVRKLKKPTFGLDRQLFCAGKLVEQAEQSDSLVI